MIIDLARIRKGLVSLCRFIFMSLPYRKQGHKHGQAINLNIYSAEIFNFFWPLFPFQLKSASSDLLDILVACC